MRVVITGAASGIGLSVAELLAADGGAHQLLLADRDADGLAAAVAKIGQSGPHPVGRSCAKTELRYVLSLRR